MKQGILITALYYGFGFGLAGLAYIIIGNPYIHAPGVHHLILFLTLVIGLIWNLSSLTIFFFKKKTQQLKGIMITNSVVIIGCVSYLAISIYLDSTDKTFIGSDIVRTEIKDDTTKIFQNENLIFIKVKDSVILDLR